MTNQELEKYMERNIHYNYLYRYYNSIDIASIYGIDKMEIKHSNFLKWLLQPKENADNTAIEYLPIRNLLKILQKNNKYYEFLNEIDLDRDNITNVHVLREKFNTDLLIFLKIKNETYIITIENKLESPIRMSQSSNNNDKNKSQIFKDQLEDYKLEIDTNYPNVKNKIFVFLHPGYQINPEQKTIVEKEQYISITYQEIYDNILKEYTELTTDLSIKFIIYHYIHTLSSYSSDNISGGLIVTDEEKKCLEALFKDEEIINMIHSLYNDKQNAYREFYNQNKAKFLQLFNKYYNITTEKDALHKEIKSIIESKSYILNKKPYKGIGTLLLDLFNTLLNGEEKKYSIEDINELIKLYPESDPLLVEEDMLKNVKHINWYTANEKTLIYNNKVYYVLSSWKSKEYEDLKEKINSLSRKNSIYKEFTLE